MSISPPGLLTKSPAFSAPVPKRVNEVVSVTAPVAGLIRRRFSLISKPKRLLS